MIRKLGRKATVASAILAIGTAGSALFAGTALANGHNDIDGKGGNGGKGGDAKVACFLPLGASLGLLGGNSGDVNQCNATAGNGGAAGTGIDEDD
jgi:hypothetical protein